MNIIKFNDTPMWYYINDSKEKEWYANIDEPGKNPEVEDARKELSAWYDKYLRGKYAGYITTKEKTYIFPIDLSITPEYIYNIEFDGKIDLLKEFDGKKYVLPIFFENENNIYKKINPDGHNFFNETSTQTDFTNKLRFWYACNKITEIGKPSIDDAKIFRPWLAEQMILVLSTYGDNEIQDLDNILHMLYYYINNMHNNTIDQLITFTSPSMQLTQTTNIASCNQCATEFVYAPGTMNVCNPVQMYKEGLYNYMVQKFSDIDYWYRFEEPLFTEIIERIDVILQYNLPLIPSNPLSTYADCTCLNKANATEELLKGILKNFRQAMQYFKDGAVEQNKLFVSNTLKDWSVYLYEKMYWAESNENLQANYWRSIER